MNEQENAPARSATWRRLLIPPRAPAPEARAASLGTVAAWGAALLICMLLLPDSVLSYFSSGLVIENDERQHLMPFVGFHQPGVMENDLIRGVMYSHTAAGSRALYWLLTLVFPTPFAAAKAVTAALFLATFYTCWRLGRAAAPAGGAALAILLVRSPLSSQVLYGGLPRSFAVPLILGFLYHLFIASERGVFAMLLLLALFYPTGMAICAVAYALFLAVELARRGWTATAPRLARMCLAGLLCLLALLPTLHKPEYAGHVAGTDDPEIRAAFGPGGRVRGVLPFAPATRALSDASRLAFQAGAPPFHWALAKVGRNAHLAIFLACAVLAAALLWRSGRRDWLLQLACFAGAGVLLYVAARAVAFRLYLPSRMLEYSLPFALAVLCCLGLSLVPRWRWAGHALPALFLLACFLVVGDREPPWGVGVVDLRPQRELYEFFRTTPSDSLVAGDPFELDNVACMSARRVYVSWENAQPFYDRYFHEILRRFRAQHQGYFATDPASLAAFLRDQKIDYLLINRVTFRPGGAVHYRLFDPLDADLFRQRNGVPYHRFVLSNDNLPGMVYHSDYFNVLDAKAYCDEARE